MQTAQARVFGATTNEHLQNMLNRVPSSSKKEGANRTLLRNWKISPPQIAQIRSQCIYFDYFRCGELGNCPRMARNGWEPGFLTRLHQKAKIRAPKRKALQKGQASEGRPAHGRILGGGGGVLIHDVRPRKGSVEDAAFVRWHHVLDVDECILSAVHLESLESLLNKVGNVHLLALGVVDLVSHIPVLRLVEVHHRQDLSVVRHKSLTYGVRALDECLKHLERDADNFRITSIQGGYK